jgi:hypothetical protein
MMMKTVSSQSLNKPPALELHAERLRLAEDCYFDITVEYAKVEPEDILMRITAANRGPDAAVLHILPTLWSP